MKIINLIDEINRSEWLQSKDSTLFFRDPEESEELNFKHLFLYIAYESYKPCRRS